MSAATEVLHSIQWHYSGPPPVGRHLDWAEGRREAALAAADHLVRWTAPDLPANPAVASPGEGWDAVIPADRRLKSLALQRGTAERSLYQRRGPAASPRPDAEDDDLVPVEAPPTADRRPHIDGRAD